jgi:hypothetical protein
MIWNQATTKSLGSNGTKELMFADRMAELRRADAERVIRAPVALEALAPLIASGKRMTAPSLQTRRPGGHR